MHGRPCPVSSPRASEPRGDAGEGMDSLPSGLLDVLAKHREAIEGFRLQQASVLRSLSEMQDAWQHSEAALQGLLGKLEDSHGADEHDAVGARSREELSSPREARSDADASVSTVRGATENLEKRRDSRIVPNAEIQRLVERIRKQDSKSQVIHPSEGGAWLQFRHRCQHVVGSTWFECLISVVIVANSAMIGVETQLNLNGQQLTGSATAELAFLAIYTAEILVRLVAQQCACFWDGWFIFDLVLVISACMEQVLYALTGDSAEQIMILRLLRLFRLVRSFRMIKQIRSIWRLVYGLVTCGEMMCSTFALLSLVIYVFGVLGVELIATNVELLANPRTSPILAEYFSSLGISMMTLSRFVTMDSIAAVYVPLIAEQPALCLYFLPLGAIVSISLMNLITAVLVEGALEHARQDREEERKMDSITTKQMLPEIVGLFDKLDLDKSGEIGIEEMLSFDGPEKGEGINRRILDRASVDNMGELFKILDVDSSGRITRDEFEEGLLNIFLREVPVSSLQMMKMLRLLRDSVNELQADLQGLQQKLVSPLRRTLP